MFLPFGPFKNEVTIYQSSHLALCTMVTHQLHIHLFFHQHLERGKNKIKNFVDPKWKLVKARRENTNQGQIKNIYKGWKQALCNQEGKLFISNIVEHDPPKILKHTQSFYIIAPTKCKYTEPWHCQDKLTLGLTGCNMMLGIQVCCWELTNLAT